MHTMRDIKNQAMGIVKKTLRNRHAGLPLLLAMGMVISGTPLDAPVRAHASTAPSYHAQADDAVTGEATDAPRSWSVGFDPNGGQEVGEGLSSVRAVEFADPVAVPGNESVSRPGYRLVGWIDAPQWEGTDGSHATFVPGGAYLHDLSYGYIELSDEEVGAVATGKGEGRLGLLSPDDVCSLPDGRHLVAVSDTLTAGTQWDESHAVETESLMGSATGKREIRLYALWERVQDGSDTDAPTASVTYDDAGNVAAITAENIPVDDVASVRDALAGAEGISKGDASAVARSLAGPLLQAESSEVPGVPRSLDGTNINSIDAEWLTPDTEDDGDDSHLYLRPGDDTPVSTQLQVSYALSGEHDYDAGDVTITIPAYIFRNRGSRAVGVFDSESTTLLPEPSRASDFNWARISDNIVLTNTRRMSAATAGMFTMSYRNITPHEMVDRGTSDAFVARIDVTTHRGNNIALQSEPIDAEFDTEQRLTSVHKDASEVTRVPASEIPEAYRTSGEEEYVVVDWSVYAYHRGNQPFSLTMTDTIPNEYGGKILSSTSSDMRSLNRTFVNGEWLDDGHVGSLTVRSVYPASQFQENVEYTFHNSVTYVLTERDPAVGNDERLVTTLTESASVPYLFRLPQFDDPQGHFMLNKYGNDGQAGEYQSHSFYRYYNRPDRLDIEFHNSDSQYGVYRSGVNNLRDGQDVEVGYTVESIGYLLPWTIAPDANPRQVGNYCQRPVTMVTYDTDELAMSHIFVDDQRQVALDASYSPSEACGHELTLGVDYEYTAVEFPVQPTIMLANAVNLKPDGSFAAISAGDGTVDYAYDPDVSHVPDVTLEAKVGGTWQDVATVAWSTGDLVIVPENGITVSGNRVSLPAGTSCYRTSVTSTNAAIWYYTRAIVTLKGNGYLGALSQEAFAHSTVPKMLLGNTASMYAYDADDSLITEFHKYGQDELRGYSTDIAVVPSKEGMMSVLTDADKAARTVRIAYSATVSENSYIPDRIAYDEAISDGTILPETSGRFYDLLPLGVTPDIGTVALRANDSITSVRTIEDYRGSGRTLLVVDAVLSPEVSTYRPSGSDTSYYRDLLAISFEARYSFESLYDYGTQLHNVIAFESTSKDAIGTVAGYSGEADDPRGTANMCTVSAFADDAERDAMTNLDASHDKPVFVYAGANTTIDIEKDARTSLNKEVMVNNDGFWSQGLYYGDEDGNDYVSREDALREKELQEGGDKRTVYEGGAYAYRLRMMSSPHTTSKGLVLYDTLEDFHAGDGNDAIDVNAPRWSGHLRGVDVRQLETLGCAPVVYYSLVPSLQLSAQDDPDRAHPTNTNLSDPTIWVKAEDYHDSLDAVTAIAVDASQRPDGTEFTLSALQSVIVIVTMQAPSGAAATTAIADDAHAYNNVHLLSSVIDDRLPDEGYVNNFVRHDYTKVGLREHNINVTKVWDDGNNRDGLRPGSVTVRLLADGAPTGLSQTISPDGDGNWQATFEHVPYTTPAGDKIAYSVEEDAVAGYSALCSTVGTDVTLTNRHEPERISISGTKTWATEGAPVPSSIVIELWKAVGSQDGGHRAMSKTIAPAEDGSWSYSFDDLFRYEDGTEIDYSIREVGCDSYVVEQTRTASGYDLTNTYHPFGDLHITKHAFRVTDGFLGREFQVRVSLSNADGTPVMGEYGWTSTDGTSGTLSSGDALTIGDGEVISITEIPEYVTYRVTEDVPDGYTLGGTALSGTILPNRHVDATITNTYGAKGFTNLQATKSLSGCEMRRYQFRFQLLDARGAVVRYANNDAEGNVVFGALNYTEADAGQTYTYTMEEIDREKPGYTYDDARYTVEVAVTDNGDGTLTVVPTYLDAEGHEVDMPSFSNSYEATGTAKLRAWKQLTGGSLADYMFDFELLDASTGRVVCVAQSDASGTIAFPALSYDEGDAGRTHRYVAREVQGDNDAVVYTDAMFGYEVSVTDNGDGTLSCSTGYVDATGALLPCETCEGDGLTGDGNDTQCGQCLGSGLRPNTNWEHATVTDMPVFVNSLKPGSLQIAKLVTSETPEEQSHRDFKFKVKLAGENLPNQIDYDIEEGFDNVFVHTGTEGTTSWGITVAGKLIIWPTNGTTGMFDAHYNVDNAPYPQWPWAEYADEIQSIYIKEGIQANQSSQYMFANMPNLTKAEIGNLVIDTSMTNTILGIFDNCPMLDTVDISGMTITGVQLGPAGIFRGQPEIDNLIARGITFDAGGVTDTWFWEKVKHMDFSYSDFSLPMNVRTLCHRSTALETVDFSYCTFGENDLYGVFEQCTALTTVNFTGVSTSRVTSMAYLFNRCSSLTDIIGISGFDTSNVTSVSGMFSGCNSLTSLDLSSFNLRSVSKYNRDLGLDNCTNLASVTLGADCVYTLADDSGVEGPQMPSGTWQHGGYSIPSADFPSTYDGSADMVGTWEKVVDDPGSGIATGVISPLLDGISRLLLPTPAYAVTEGWTENGTCEWRIADGTLTIRPVDDGDEGVLGFRGWTSDTSITTLDIQGTVRLDANYYNGLFAGLTSLHDVDLSGLDVSSATSLNNMFERCESLESLDLSGMNFACDCSSMFAGSGIVTVDAHDTKFSGVATSCFFYRATNLTEVNMLNADLSEATTLASMFRECTSLTTIEGIADWDTSSVTRVDYMFADCSSLESLDLSGWHVENLYTDYNSGYYVSYMLNNAVSLRELNISNWHIATSPLGESFNSYSGISNLKIIAHNLIFEDNESSCCFISGGVGITSIDFTGTVFPNTLYCFCYGCTNLKEVILDNVDTSHCTNMSYMFENCYALEEIDCSSFDVSHVTTAQGMFEMQSGSQSDGTGPAKLRRLDVSGWNVASMENINYFAQCCPYLDIDCSSWTNTSHIREMDGFLAGSGKQASTADFTGFDFSGCSRPQYSRCIFRNIHYENLILDNTVFAVSSSDDASTMWSLSNFEHVSYVSMRNADLSAITNASYMFEDSDCIEIDMTNVNLSNATRMYYYFRDSPSLQQVIGLETVDMSNVTDMQEMFAYCSALRQVNMRDAKINKVTTMRRMMSYCYALQSVDMSNIDTTNLTTAEEIFCYCQELRSIKCDNWDVTSLTTMRYGITYCPKLQDLDLSSWRNWNVTANFESLLDKSGDGSGVVNLSGASITYNNWAIFRDSKFDKIILDYATISCTGNQSWFRNATVNYVSMKYATVGNNNQTLRRMFAETHIRRIDLTAMDATHAESMECCFANSTELEQIVLTDIKTPNLMNASSMFSGCTSLEKLDLSSMDFTHVFTDSGHSAADMFKGTDSLSAVVIPDMLLFVADADSSNHGDLLMTPPTEAPHDGKWLYVEGNESFTPAELVTNPGAGTYVWDVNPKIIITYDSNGGIGTPIRDVLSIGSHPVAADNTFMMWDHDFVGWNTKADGSGTPYLPGDEVENIVTNDNLATLYAQWQQREHTTDLENGEFEVMVPAGATVTIPNLPAGTTYQVWEETPSGWVLVEKSGVSGVISPLDASVATFKNDYQPGMVSAQIFASKTLDGRPADANEFSFEIVKDGTTLETVRNTDGGAVAFSPIRYSYAGTYTYVIREKRETAQTEAYASVDEDGTLRLFRDEPGKYENQQRATVGGKKVVFFTGIEDVEAAIGSTAWPWNAMSQSDYGYYFRNGIVAPYTLKRVVIEDPIRLKTAAWLFSYIGAGNSSLSQSVPAIEGMENLDISQATSMQGMFSIARIGNIDIRTLDTRNVTDMSSLFSGTRSASIDVTGLDASAVMTVDRLTQSLSEAKVLDLSTWNLNTTLATGWESILNGTDYDIIVLPQVPENSVRCPSGKTYKETSTGVQVTTNDYMTQGTWVIQGRDPISYDGSLSLRKTRWSDSDLLENADMDYDTHEGTVAVVVTDDGLGNLTATVQQEDGSLAFANRHVPGTLKVTKRIQGASDASKDDEFTIVVRLSDADGNPVTTVETQRGGDDTRRASLFGRLLSGIGSLFSATEAHAEEIDPLAGTAYAILTNDHEFILFRSTESYTAGTGKTVMDIAGNTYTGQLYTGIETYDPGTGYVSYSNSPWYSQKSSIYSVRVAPGQTIRPINMSRWFYSAWNLTSVDLTGLDTSQVKSFYNTFCGTGISSMDATQISIASAQNLESMFASTDITTLDLSNWVIPTNLTYSMSSMFPSGLQSITLGSGFKFKPYSDYSGGTRLPNASSSDSAGMWQNEAKNAGPYTPDELAQAYDGSDSMTGTWTHYHISYSIAFDANQGVGAIPTVEGISYGSEVSLPLEEGRLTRPGCLFDGWSLNSSGNPLLAEDGGKVSNLTKLNGDTVTLFARWKDKSYEIVYDGNGSQWGRMPNQTVTRNQPENLLENQFWRWGHVLAGWNTEPDGTGESYDDQGEVVNLCLDEPSITLYAQWEHSAETWTSTTGSYTFTLKGGESLSFVDLPAGTRYEVEETAIPSGWRLSADHGTSGEVAPDAVTDAMFLNTYSATGTATVQVKKELVGRTPVAGEFSFDLTDSEGNVIQSVGNGDADLQETIPGTLIDMPNPDFGKAPVTFPDIAFTKPGTYTYSVSEVTGTDDQVTYDGTVIPVTITVSDAGHGNLACEVAYGAPSTTLTNRIKPGTLEIAKVVQNVTSASVNTEFPFVLSLVGPDGEPLQSVTLPATRTGTDGTETDETITVRNGQAAVTLLGGEMLSIGDIGDGVTYEVEEGESPGWALMSSEGASGTVVANATSTASFTNDYSATGTFRVEARKVLLGSDLADGQFSFLLTDGDGRFAGRATCSADGSIVFSDIPIDAEWVGETRQYHIAEEVPVSVPADSPYTYDSHTEDVSVEFADDGQGNLTGSVTYDGDGAVFTNSYALGMPGTGRQGMRMLLSCVCLMLVSVALMHVASRRRRKGNEE